MNQNTYSEGLKNLQPPDGTPPASRVVDAGLLQGMLQRWIQNDYNRSFKRSKVQGLIDGNPTYSLSKAVELGRGDLCRANWGTAASYASQAEGIFYDLFSEAPTHMTILTKHGNVQEQSEFSRIMTEEAHEVLTSDPRWDYLIQNSQKQMVIHGCGPIWFEDRFSVMPRFSMCGDLKVSESAESETYYWDCAFILQTYKPHELYEFIKDEEAATRAGWNVPYTKQVIMAAQPDREQKGLYRDWEYYQNLYKSNSFASSYDSDVIKVATCYWKEFDGSITQAIIEQSSQAASSFSATGEGPAVDFLFRHVGRFNSWSQTIHPFYYDKGNGKHYTVTGMGVKMYGAFVAENRLMCKLVDDAMAPKTAFKPQTESATPFNMVQIGSYAKLSAGWDMQQIGINGLLDDGLAMLNQVSRMASNNLAQYRQTWHGGTGGPGNPPTASQVKVESQQQYAVAGTAISRYYTQLDHFYSEIVRRLCDLNTNDPLAIEFQKRCVDQGVPREAFGRIRKVEANRVSGQGSAALRQMALDSLMQMLARFPEEGQANLINDWVASRTGYRGARRYNPNTKENQMGTEQEAEAMLQVAAMKTGVPPIITSEQNPVVFASTFLGAAGQAAGTVAQGANPVEVLSFIELAAPAAHAHMQRFANDPTRAGLYKEMDKMFKQLSQVADQMRKKVEEQQKQAQQQSAQQGQQLPPDVQQKLAIEDAKGKLKLQQMALSHQQRLRQRAEQHAMQLQSDAQRTQSEVAANDLRTAAEIKRNRIKAVEETQ